MFSIRRSLGPLLIVFASAVLAQPGSEVQVSDNEGAAPRDPDVVALEELVHELRESSNKYDPESVLIASEDEMLVIIEECEVYEWLDTALSEAELEVEQMATQDQMVRLRAQFSQVRLEAFHDCCYEQSAVCFQ